MSLIALSIISKVSLQSNLLLLKFFEQTYETNLPIRCEHTNLPIRYEQTNLPIRYEHTNKTEVNFFFKFHFVSLFQICKDHSFCANFHDDGLKVLTETF
jgi:hypothetical protein